MSLEGGGQPGSTVELLAHAGCAPSLLLQVAALRALAVLGKNELVQQAAGKPAIQGRGLRILSMGGSWYLRLRVYTVLYCLLHAWLAASLAWRRP